MVAFNQATAAAAQLYHIESNTLDDYFPFLFFTFFSICLSFSLISFFAKLNIYIIRRRLERYISVMLLNVSTRWYGNESITYSIEIILIAKHLRKHMDAIKCNKIQENKKFVHIQSWHSCMNCEQKIFRSVRIILIILIVIIIMTNTKINTFTVHSETVKSRKPSTCYCDIWEDENKWKHHPIEYEHDWVKFNNTYTLQFGWIVCIVWLLSKMNNDKNFWKERHSSSLLRKSNRVFLTYC